MALEYRLNFLTLCRWMLIMFTLTASCHVGVFATDADILTSSIQDVKYEVKIIGTPVLLPEPSNESIRLQSKHGQSFTCDLRLSDGQKDKPEPPVVDNAMISAWLSPLQRSKCLQLNTGWWTYSFCYKRQITQFHEVNNQRVSESLLGSYESEFDWTTQSQQSPEIAQKYHSQQYTNGTICDLTGKPRRVEVRFICAKTTAFELISVVEHETCVYVFKVATPSLCAHPTFAPESRPKSKEILCQPALAEPDFEKYNAEKKANQTQRQSASVKSKERSTRSPVRPSGLRAIYQMSSAAQRLPSFPILRRHIQKLFSAVDQLHQATSFSDDTSPTIETTATGRANELTKPTKSISTGGPNNEAKAAIPADSETQTAKLSHGSAEQKQASAIDLSSYPSLLPLRKNYSDLLDHVVEQLAGTRPTTHNKTLNNLISVIKLMLFQIDTRAPISVGRWTSQRQVFSVFADLYQMMLSIRGSDHQLANLTDYHVRRQLQRRPYYQISEEKVKDLFDSIDSESKDLFAHEEETSTGDLSQATQPSQSEFQWESLVFQLKTARLLLKLHLNQLLELRDHVTHPKRVTSQFSEDAKLELALHNVFVKRQTGVLVLRTLAKSIREEKSQSNEDTGKKSSKEDVDQKDSVESDETAAESTERAGSDLPSSVFAMLRRVVNKMGDQGVADLEIYSSSGDDKGVFTIFVVPNESQRKERERTMEQETGYNFNWHPAATEEKLPSDGN